MMICMYLPAITYANWVEHIEGNALVRLQSERFVYALKAERVTDPESFRAICAGLGIEIR